jgi:hypothetical protein
MIEYFRGYNNLEIKTEVSIYENVKTNKFVVIFTELPDNTGSSVTNACEILIAETYDRYFADRNVPIENIIWIEEYPESDVRFSQIIFDSFSKEKVFIKINYSLNYCISGTRWIFLKEEYVEDMLSNMVLRYYTG